MRTNILSRWKALGALVALPILLTIAFAPGGGGEEDHGAAVETSMGPVALPGDAVAPSVANSAGPIAVDGVTIGNFGVVNGRIFRGEQPGKTDYTDLAKLGVATVIDLRLEAKSTSRELAEGAGLKYVNIPIDDHKQPSDEDVAKFLGVIEAPESGVCYVHCAGGRHRTGSMIAVYRMVHDGWTIDKAYEEMLAYDFYTRNGHKGFKTYVYDYYDRMTTDPTKVPKAFAPPPIAQQVAASELPPPAAATPEVAATP